MKKLLYSCVFALMCAAPASAQTWIHFDSDPGDYIGQGQRQTWTHRDGTFSASVISWSNAVAIEFDASGESLSWSLEFAAPHDARVQPGVYLGATRYPFQDDANPGLTVSGDGRGCNKSSGWFQVLEVVYGAGNQVVSFAADFEQHCEFGIAALRGGVRFNSAIPYAPTPAAYSPLARTAMEFISEKGDSIGGGVPSTVTRQDGVFSAGSPSRELVNVYFEKPYTPGSSFMYWRTSFSAPAGQTLVRGRYLNAVRHPFQPAGVPGLSVTSSGRGCNTVKGWFDVLDIVRNGPEVVSLAIDFVQHCEGAAPALYGSIRYNSRLPYSQPFDVDADTMPDILFHRQSDGALQAWNTVNTTRRFAFGLALPSLPSNEWRIVGTGDLNADGVQDIVAQHRTTRHLIVWHLQGTKLLDGAYLSPDQLPEGWDAVGVTDLDGDRHADVLLRHADGWVAVWLMNGRTLRDGRMLPEGYVPDRGWRIVGAADFNADGSNDLIWEHEEGGIAAWLMRGTSRLDVVWLTPNRLPSGWSIGGVTDLNQDGSPDLLLQHTDGSVAVWFLQGTTLLDGRMLSPSTPGAGWRLAGPR